jgi:outer membrane protein assembly factor BamB/ribosomal protein L7/L12
MSNNAPASLTCPTCGAPLDFDGTHAVVRCTFCGNSSLIPGILPAQAAAPSSALDEIRHMAGSENLVDAIERYSQLYGVDAQEARNAIDALKAGRLATASMPGTQAPEELTRALKEVQHLLQGGDKIGAIKVYREHYDVSLARAKYAVEQIAAGQTSMPEAGFPSPVNQTGWSETGVRSTDGQAGKKQAQSARRRIGCVTLIAILVVGGGFLLFKSFQPAGPLARHYYPSGPVALVPSDQAAGPDIAAGLFNADADTRFIGLVDGTTGKLRWQADKLSGDGYADAIISGSDLVYVANASDLLAYKKSDGSLAWQAQMPDKLNYGEDTMLVTAGRVITINADQSIQAYDAETGRQVWSKRLSGYDRSLRLMGTSLVVIDYIDNNYTYGLVFLDPASGEQKNSISPTCTYNDYDSHIDTDTGLVYGQAANTLFMVFDSSYGCVQRLDLSNDQVIWSVSSEDSFSFVPYGFQYLQTDSSLYFGRDNDILAVDKSTGKISVLLTNPDYSMLPMAVTGNKMVVRARRTRGTERFELWGLDISTGAPLWRLDLLGSSPIDPPNEMSGLIDDTGSGWTWKLTPTGLVLIKFMAQPNQILMETFNPADGTSLGKQTFPLNKVSGDFYSIPKIIGWQGQVAYLSIEQGLYTLDLTGGSLHLVY